MPATIPHPVLACSGPKLQWKEKTFFLDAPGALKFLNNLPEKRPLEAKITKSQGYVIIWYRE